MEDVPAKFIKDYYYEHYQRKNTFDRKRLTNTVNAILESLPPKVMAMALVALIDGNKDMFDAEELNEK
jgi:hypothetical protein